ncbi:carotenoid 1,2-hydratase [Ramlibacter henchirensis]|uniref:Carotenoid 1,2-hydratase n=1 Tax=Ramlibacter henchirensis TaxID=204072 RepID=A0A4Z0BUP9_9BURK|nr:carotenoid 1,2-hydratase [Ramlibacter henchirensis]TFZ02194.1 carotenoid 1,2-hydratase [Ramlibacter henchirensis]
MRRRALLTSLPMLAWPGARALPARTLQFPRDHGAHPDLRTEWWYITGAADSGGRAFGFQLTFFRSRVDAAQDMASKFAARQLIFAHAAVTDVQGRRLWHDQRIAREGFGVAVAEPGDTRVHLRDWYLQRRSDGGYEAKLAAGEFTIDLRFSPTQPLLLQGAQGLSRKGPEPEQASYYYSVPQLGAAGTIRLQGRAFDVRGKAWLDHEWSEALMHPDAVGWDWIGMNLDDGSALSAFQLRRKDGSPLWDGGSFRAANGYTYIASRGENRFSAQRRWSSPLSGATYPVEWIVQTPADFYTVRAVVDAQELDSRQSTGAVYWEGLSDLLDSNGRRVGRGYLEMTGYSQRLKL